MDSTKINLPFKFEIDKILLITEGKSVDIRGLMTELHVTQSIFENTMSAQIKILDSEDRLSTNGQFIIKGGERLEIKFKAQSDKKYFSKIFFVSKISNTQKEAAKAKSYMLDLITGQEILNDKIKISKAYNRKISDIVEEILKQYLSIPEIKVEPTKNSISYISPYIAPFKLINTLSTYAIADDDSASFCCYESSFTTHFRSLSSLLSQKPANNFIYASNTKKFLSNNLQLGNVLVQELNFTKNIDIQNNTISGMYKSNLLLHNILLKQYGGKQINSSETIKYDYDDYFKNTKHLEKTKINNPKNFSDYNSMYKYFHRDVVKSEHFKKPPKLEFYDNQSNLWLQKRYALHAQLDNIVCDIVIPGNCDLVCGDVITLAIALDRATQPGESFPINEKYSGKYIITTLKHVLNVEKLTTYATCVKDSTNV